MAQFLCRPSRRSQVFTCKLRSERSGVRWKQGLEPPPFTACNTAAVELVLALANGAVDHVPSIGLSAAVAVQIHRLFFDSEAGHKLLSRSYDALYRVLASLKFGMHVELPDMACQDCSE